MKVKSGNFKPEKILYFFTLIFSAVFLFWNIHSIMFAVHDDILIYSIVKQGRLVDFALNAVRQGRITHLWNTFLLGIPFAADSQNIYNIFRFSSFIFDAAGMYILLKNHTETNFARISLLILFSSVCLSPYHNLLTAYAFCHQISIGILLFSVDSYLCYLKSGKKFRLISASVLLLIASMIYEAFTVFIILYAAAAIIKNKNPRTGKINIKKFFNDFIVPFSVISVYVIFYFTWQQIYPISYDGNLIYLSEPFLSLKTVYDFSVSFSPVYQFFELCTIHKMSFYEFASLITLGSLAKAMLVSFVFFSLMPRISFRNYGSLILLFSAPAIFMPNIITGFTEKYVNWKRRGDSGYLSSFYSYFFLIIFLLAVVCMIYMHIKDHKGQKIFLCFITAAVFILCIFSDVTTDVWKNHYTTQFLKYRCFDAAVSSEFVTGLDSGTEIYIPDNTGIHSDMKLTEEYAGIYTNKQHSFHTNINELDFAEKTVCMRYKSEYNIMIMAYTDKNLYAEKIHIAIPDNNSRLTLVMSLSDGSITEYKNVKNGDVISAENGKTFDLS